MCSSVSFRMCCSRSRLTKSRALSQAVATQGFDQVLFDQQNEPASLRSLAPKAPAAAVEVQHLDLRGAPIGEHEQLPRQRVSVEALAGQCVQTVAGFAHVCGLAVQEHADAARGEERQRRTRSRLRHAVPSNRSSTARQDC